MWKTISFALASFVAAFLLTGFLAGAAAGRAGAADGKSIFLAQKCNLCHSVSTQGIEKVTKSSKMAGPDLVNVSASAAVLIKYLRKQAEINGKKHAKGFTGSDADLATLVAWIKAQRK